MEYHSTHIIKGYNFGNSIGYIKCSKPVRISIYIGDSCGYSNRFFAFDEETGASITGFMSGVGSATLEGALKYNAHILMCYGASKPDGAIWRYLKERANKSFARPNKRLNFIAMKLNKII